MILNQLLKILVTILGQSTDRPQQGGYGFYCPFCKHHKKKLFINLNAEDERLGFYHCWVCNEGGRSLPYLLKKLNVNNTLIERVRNIISQYKKEQIFTKKRVTKQSDKNSVWLPNQFEPLYKRGNGVQYNHAINYLKSRGITMADIIRYNIGYCETGQYKSMLIFPSYDQSGQLNYFVARSYFKGDQIKYLFPKVNRNQIIFNQLLVNWKQQIFICQGIFDALTLGNNAVPLMGKFMSRKILSKITQNRPKLIRVVLDGDAHEDALKIAQELIKYDLIVQVIKLKQQEDPNTLGVAGMMQVISNGQRYTFKDKIMNMLKKI